MNVELRLVPNCPSASAASDLLRTSLDQAGLADQGFSVVMIDSDTRATELAFVGSPAFVVDDHDLLADADSPAGLTCRVYRAEDGTSAGLPDRARVVAALLRIAGSSRHPDRSDQRHICPGEPAP
jgi:hypothetical protein